VYLLSVRVVVWALLVILALIVLPIGVLLLAGLIRRLQIVRTRHALERMGFVVSLPNARETRSIWPRLGVALAGLAALVIATSLLPGGPLGRTLASTADSSLPGAPAPAPVVQPGANLGSEHPSLEKPATMPGAGRPTASPPSSESPAAGPGSDAGAPSTVTALPTSATAIQLRWAPVTGAARYDVERSIDAVSWHRVAHIDGTQTRYTDGALTSGTTYYYRVAAIVNGQAVSSSDVVSATTTTVDTPAAPVLISATGSATSVDLTWSDVDGELGYRIERSPDGTSGWTPIGTTGQGVTSFTDTGLVSATTYYYRVVAVTSDSESPPSTVLSATTDPGAPPTSEPNSAQSGV
jgi:Fibronectin type III domain